MSLPADDPDARILLRRIGGMQRRPATARLADLAGPLGWTPRRARRALGILIRSERVVVEMRPGGANRYHLPERGCPWCGR